MLARYSTGTKSSKLGFNNGNKDKAIFLLFLNSENIFATAEELWIKEIAKKNNKFRNIVLVNNSSETIMPQLYFKEKYEYQTEIEKLLQSKAITKKSLYLKFNKFIIF